MRYSKKPSSNEAYRLWFEFLKLADRSRCTPEVLEDFGEVWETEFDVWWESHRKLFEQPEPLTFEVFQAAKQFEHLEGSDDLLFVAIPLLAPKARLIKQFERFLRDWHPAERGRPVFEDLAERYPLCTRPYLEGLRKTLAVYKLHLSNPELSGIDIEEKVGLITKKRLNEKTIWQVASTPKEFERLKNIQASTVSRYLKQANKLIENVQKGIFPMNR